MINHALGVTAEQNIFFAPDLSGGTMVRITMDLVGESSEMSESALQSKVTYVIKDVLDSMAVLCRRSASPASG